MYKHIHYNILSQRKIYMILFCGLTTFARMRSDPQKSPVFAFFFLCLFFAQTRKSSLTGSKVPFCGILGKRLLGAIFCLYCSLANARSHKTYYDCSYIYSIYTYIELLFNHICFVCIARSLTLAR
jgi:hypothetical protein